MTDRTQSEAPLEGIRVIDASTLFAAPTAATLLADFGADVIKVEHPRGDPVRRHGYTKNGVGLWWKVIGRNKRTMTLDLSTDDGQEVMRRLTGDSDVLIENFRPGTLERWNLAPEDLMSQNEGLIVARVTGFGQLGPYASRPGFGTLAEAMSGFAHLTGASDGPPTLPPFGLADGIAGLMTANAILMALYHRDLRGGSGQVIDVSLVEPVFSLIGPQAIVYQQLGISLARTGNRSINNAPRNTYRTRDGKWVAVASSTESTARRVMELIGRSEVTEEPWFSSGRERAEHPELIDEPVAEWIAAHDAADVISAFEKAEAAIAPVYAIEDIMSDPQFDALDAVVEVDDDELGTVVMQNVPFRLAGTPGEIRWAGRPVGHETDEVLSRLGYSSDEIETLRQRNVI